MDDEVETAHRLADLREQRVDLIVRGDVAGQDQRLASERAGELTDVFFEARGGGSIVTLSFLGSDRVFPNYNVMGVAKAALESTVRYLAADLGPKNIRVNAVSAGPVKTLAAAGIGGFSTILGVVREKAPLRRTIESAEVAEAALFLLGPAGSGVTGEVLMVDAGYHAVGM